MKKKHIFLTTFIALLSVMSLMICSVYRNDQIQELGVPASRRLSGILKMIFRREFWDLLSLCVPRMILSNSIPGYRII